MTLYQRLQKKGANFNHVCEVGVFEPETANLLDFIKNNVRATLIEADPAVARRIEHYFSDHNITVHTVAIWDYTGKQNMARASASTFIVDVQASPALKNDNYQIEAADTFEVDCVVFSVVDDGTIDLLSVDIEGSEWYVLKNMSSRPNVISIETHGKHYINPFMDEIADWMRRNDYKLWYKDNTDSVYVRAGFFGLTTGEKLMLTLKNGQLLLRRKKLALLKKLGLR